MLNEVIEIINETYSPTIEVTGDTAIKTDLGLDSFEMINLMFLLEDKYKITINELDAGSMVTVNDIFDYIINKR